MSDIDTVQQACEYADASIGTHPRFSKALDSLTQHYEADIRSLIADIAKLCEENTTLTKELEGDGMGNKGLRRYHAEAAVLARMWKREDTRHLAALERVRGLVETWRGDSIPVSVEGGMLRAADELETALSDPVCDGSCPDGRYCREHGRTPHAERVTPMDAASEAELRGEKDYKGWPIGRTGPADPIEGELN